MIKEFPKERAAKREMLLGSVDEISEILRASGPKSEELGTLAPEAVSALRDTGMFRLKLCAEMGGAEADPRVVAIKATSAHIAATVQAIADRIEI